MLTEKQRHCIGHALGYNQAGRAFRNYFVTGPGSNDWDTWEALVAEGLAMRHGPSPLYGGDYCFLVTEAGKAAYQRAAEEAA